MVLFQLYNSFLFYTSAIYPLLGIPVSRVKGLFSGKRRKVLSLRCAMLGARLMRGAITLFAAIILCSCAPTPAPTPSLTVTPLPPTVTATPTVVWFPPTATFTPYPTVVIEPTPEQRPGIGDMILEDDFSDPQVWTSSISEEGSVALGVNELTIAIAENNERAYLVSTRIEPSLSDFYMEITANPMMCRGKDEYGVLLRVASQADYYRFSLSCDGSVRMDRIYHGQATSPQTWLLSGAVPPGAPSSSRLGVWAVGDEMRFFVNDEYQFTVTDPLLPSGLLGVFARSASDMAVTVNFSNLVVYTVTGNN
jgi:hypothetical protein